MTFNKFDRHIRDGKPLEVKVTFTPHELQAIQDFMCKPHYERNQHRMVDLLEATFMDPGSEGVIQDDIRPGGF